MELQIYAVQEICTKIVVIKQYISINMLLFMIAMK